jgi:hypothetical protein
MHSSDPLTVDLAPFVSSGPTDMVAV